MRALGAEVTVVNQSQSYEEEAVKHVKKNPS